MKVGNQRTLNLIGQFLGTLAGGWLMMELIERRDVASQKVGVRLYFSQIDLVILILIPVRRNGQPLILVGIREISYMTLK